MNEQLNFFFSRIKSITYALFTKIKNSIGEDWLRELIKKYGEELKIPWTIRRLALFDRIVKKAQDFKDRINDAKEAFAAWLLFKREILDTYKITNEDLERAVSVLERLHREQKYPRGLFIWNPTHGEYKRVSLLAQYGPQEDIEDIEKAFDIGYYLYPFMKDVSPLILLGLLLPALDPENKNVYLEEALIALKMAKLADFWYSLIERREQPDFEHWKFWESFIKKWNERKKAR